MRHAAHGPRVWHACSTSLPILCIVSVFNFAHWDLIYIFPVASMWIIILCIGLIIFLFLSFKNSLCILLQVIYQIYNLQIHFSWYTACLCTFLAVFLMSNFFHFDESQFVNLPFDDFFCVFFFLSTKSDALSFLKFYSVLCQNKIWRAWDLSLPLN